MGFGLTGATRLAAAGAVRIGAGLVAVIADADTALIYRASLSPHFVLTPHEDEFARAFPQLKDSRAAKAAAAKAIGAHIVLKGASTIIAAPDGKIIINRNTSPHLATAGSGNKKKHTCSQEWFSDCSPKA